MEKALADALEMAEKKAEEGKAQEEVEKNQVIEYIFLKSILFKKFGFI
ncbi:hypothetical protein HYT25_00440 [Candidatus Pacearchaeota archaeon]|nr:hypothetical protein [Candidatus Pacearchaeota archaeon]